MGEQRLEKERKKQQCSFPITQPFSPNTNMPDKKSATESTSREKKQSRSQQQQMRANTIDNAILHNDTIQENNTPLFERLQTEEIAELKSYNKILSIKNHQISTFETLLEDLESRLEIETSQKLKLQHLLEYKNDKFKKEVKELKNDVDAWKNRVHVEKIKNKKLLGEVNKKDKEIHKM